MEKEFSIEQVEQLATSRRSDELIKYLAPFLESDPHADALAMMGLCYDRGHGVSRDHEEAMRHYQESAEKGSMYRQFHYGWHLLATPKACSEEEDCSKGLEWLEKAAQNGSAPAQYELGLYYWELDRKEEAEAYFKKAAEAGHLWAHRYVGMLHRARCLQCLRLGLVSLQESEEGSDTERCVTERSSESNEAIENAGHVFTAAFHWIGEINTKDDAILQCICADIYRHYGSKDDKTLEWYKKAGAHSRPAPKYETWSFEPNKRERLSVDIPETFCWLSPARWERMVCQEAVQLRKSILYARVKVAELLQEQDPRRALSWWEKVRKLEPNHVEADLHIGESYYHGWGSPQDYKLALAAFRSVLKEKPDHDKASLYVALCYHRGLGVE